MLTIDPDYIPALPPGFARLSLIHDAAPVMPVTACLISLDDLNALLGHVDGLGEQSPGDRLHQLLVAYTCCDDQMHSLSPLLVADEIRHIVAWVTTRRCG